MAKLKRGDIVKATSNIKWALPNTVDYLERASLKIKPGTEGRIVSTGMSSEPYVRFESATVEFDCGAMIIEVPRVPQSSLALVRSAEQQTVGA